MNIALLIEKILVDRKVDEDVILSEYSL